jgi:hypothetical protein
MYLMRDSFLQKILAWTVPLVLVPCLLAVGGEGWKVEVDILHGATYGGKYGSFSKGHVHVDKNDRLWLPVQVFFPDEEANTDAYAPRVSLVVMISDDRGRTWSITKQKPPVLERNRVALPNGTVMELGSSGWIRYPRTRIKSLQQKGYHVWDLGAANDYCAIIHDLWQKTSVDGGKTWRKREIHKQLPFFAHFVARGPLRRFDDGGLVFLAYGYGKDDRSVDSKTKGVGMTLGRSHVYCIRSDDGGKNWKAVRVADGSLSPLTTGFSETFPVIDSDGRIFLMIRTGLGSPAYAVSSMDGGRTWSKVTKTPINAKHPLPWKLSDGAVVCSYQRRGAVPYGVRARFTRDMGKTWSDEVVLRDDVPISNALAEANTVQFSDGTLFTAFQAVKLDDRGRVQPFISGCHWSRDYRGVFTPRLPVPPRQKKINSKKTGS